MEKERIGWCYEIWRRGETGLKTNVFFRVYIKDEEINDFNTKMLVLFRLSTFVIRKVGSFNKEKYTEGEGDPFTKEYKKYIDKVLVCFKEALEILSDEQKSFVKAFFKPATHTESFLWITYMAFQYPEVHYMDIFSGHFGSGEGLL
jgi:hypothetical protein